MANPVIRVSDTTHREVSHYAAKVDKTMRDVGDEIVRAGLRALANGEPHAAVPSAPSKAPPTVEAVLRAALPVEAIKVASDYQRALATRKRAEVVTLAESVARLVASGVRRLTSSQAYARSLHRSPR